jgi:hypothetical protein
MAGKGEKVEKAAEENTIASHLSNDGGHMTCRVLYTKPFLFWMIFRKGEHECNNQSL